MLLGTFNPIAGLPPGATNFGTYPLGAQLKDQGWTEHGAVGGDLTDGSYEIVADPDSLSGKAVHVSQGGVDEYRACTWDQIGDVTDCEILALIKLIELPNAIGGGGICRHHFQDGYDCVFDASAVGGFDGSCHVSKFTNGFFDAIVGGANQGIDLNLDGQYWMRFRINGNQLGAKAWRRGTPEPANFLTGTNSQYTHGRVGIQTVEQRDFRVYWFSVAVGAGKRAPGPVGVP